MGSVSLPGERRHLAATLHSAHAAGPHHQLFLRGESELQADHRPAAPDDLRRGDDLCQQQKIESYLPACRSIPSGVVDDALSTLIQESVSPLALEVALSVQQELQERLAEADLLRRQYGRAGPI